MLCLFDWHETPEPGILTRLQRARAGYKGFRSAEIVILGMKALSVTLDVTPAMPLKTVRKRIGAAAERMRAERARKVLFSKNFPYRAHVLREGFNEINEGRLMELLAGKIAAILSGGNKAAAFFARRLTGEAEGIFCELCRDFKYVMAAVESEESRFYHALGRRLGISVLVQPTEQQLSKADVAVFLSPPLRQTVLPDKCIAIPVADTALNGVVCRKAVSGLTVELAGGRTPDIPEGFALEPLIAAAIDAGSLNLREVIVRALDYKDMYV